jgi:hypothetical protein
MPQDLGGVFIRRVEVGHARPGGLLSQDAMRVDLAGSIEKLTGRTVIGFMSDNHIDPDLGVEVFILRRSSTASGSSPVMAGWRLGSNRVNEINAAVVSTALSARTSGYWSFRRAGPSARATVGCS